MISNSTLEAVKNKDKNSFKVLYQQCIPYVYTVVQRHLSNNSDVPDVIQEIFARVFLSIHTFDAKKGEFKSWLRRLAINQCYQYYRKENFVQLHVELDNAHEVADDELLLGELTKEEIEELLDNMPDGYRRVFLLVIIDEYTHEEVGELLGISADSSRSQLSRAKKWLRKHTPPTIKSLANGL
ncbi:MAG: RNA polymerase sigma factor [Phaeodactylibacter sp.]|nr:RNA polymerase sigma factor [Phaeodactylibacter sp.]MCB9052745.1 RNA polymerase sigma factor [Lewinellaceae bacterium]